MDALELEKKIKRMQFLLERLLAIFWNRPDPQEIALFLKEVEEELEEAKKETSISHLTDKNKRLLNKH